MFPRSNRHLILPLFLVALLALASQSAWAHAILMESTPAINSQVQGPDITILLRFNVRVDGNRSRLTLAPADGPSDDLRIVKQASPDSLGTVANGLKPGGYTLRWKVLASDGHMSSGEVPFTVK